MIYQLKIVIRAERGKKQVTPGRKEIKRRKKKKALSIERSALSRHAARV